MSGQPTYKNDTCEELLDLSRANGQAIVLATAAFLREVDVPAGVWTAFLGELFARSWDPTLELTAGEFLDAMLTNYRSLGADVISATLGDERAEAVIAGFPKRELCLELGVDGELALEYFNVPAVLAGLHNFAWHWERDDVRTKLLVTSNQP
jgi:hypothetical protein